MQYSAYPRYAEGHLLDNSLISSSSPSFSAIERSENSHLNMKPSLMFINICKFEVEKSLV